MLKKYTTLKDIANKLEVSVTTVSKALNDHPDISVARKKQVMDLIKKLHYIPNTIAKNLRKSSTNFIGLVVSDSINPYGIQLIRGVEKELSLYNYNTLIFYNDEDPEKEIKIFKELLSINVAGVITVPAAGNSENIKYLKNFDLPYVLANRYLKKNKDNYVVADDVKAGYLATDYLINKYRSRKIIFINGFKGKVSSAMDRLTGYKNALKKNKLVYEESLVYSGIENQSSGYDIIKNIILKKHKIPFSIICYNDFIASGVIKALNDSHINIPKEIAVMGIDNIELLSFSYPSLSTIDISQFDIGKKSANLIISLIEKEKFQENKVVIEPKLIIRGST